MTSSSLAGWRSTPSDPRSKWHCDPLTVASAGLHLDSDEAKWDTGSTLSWTAGLTR